MLVVGDFGRRWRCLGGENGEEEKEKRRRKWRITFSPMSKSKGRNHHFLKMNCRERRQQPPMGLTRIY